jgi:hypothetical protein
MKHKKLKKLTRKRRKNPRWKTPRSMMVVDYCLQNPSKILFWDEFDLAEREPSDVAGLPTLKEILEDY